MDTISDTAILAALGRHLTQAVARESVAAGNLANLDTPGYRAREATFEDALSDELDASLPMARTAATHLAPAVNGRAAGSTEASGLPSRRDGNNVQLDRELLALNRAAVDFNAAQTALAAKFRLVRYAINEGR